MECWLSRCLEVTCFSERVPWESLRNLHVHPRDICDFLQRLKLPIITPMKEDTMFIGDNQMIVLVPYSVRFPIPEER